MDLEGVSAKNSSSPYKESIWDPGKGWWAGDGKPKGEDLIKGGIIAEMRQTKIIN